MRPAARRSVTHDFSGNGFPYSALPMRPHIASALSMNLPLLSRRISSVPPSGAAPIGCNLRRGEDQQGGNQQNDECLSHRSVPHP